MARPKDQKPTREVEAESDLARVVALAGLGEGSFRTYKEELRELAAELEAAFDEPTGEPQPLGTQVHAPSVGLDDLRDDIARERKHSNLWLGTAPSHHENWLDVPPVRGTGDEDPKLPFGHDPRNPSVPRPAPQPAPAHDLPAGADDATALAAAIASGSLTAQAALDAHRANLIHTAPATHLDAWHALVDSLPVEAPPTDGPGSALFGLPFVIKTNISVEGFETNCASHSLANWRPNYTATCVRRLIRAGLVPFASANMDEFAMGSSGERSAYGATRNPWSDLDGPPLAPGGSSSGSAAAVSAGLCALSLGTDAGGSIRQPAAFCGVSGLRPSQGRISRFGVVAFSSSFDTVGPIARSARDLLAAFEIMAGPDVRDETTTNKAPAPLSPNGWTGVRIGVPRKLIEACELEPAVAVSFAQSLSELETLGATLVIVELGGPSGRPDAALSAYHVISCAEAASNLARIDGMRFGAPAPRRPDTSFKIARRDLRENTLGPEVKRRVLIGTFSLARAGAPSLFRAARRAQANTTAEFTHAFATCDIVAMPTSPTVAFAHDTKLHDPMAMYRADLLTVPASLAGVAAVSIPGPIQSGGLPVGFQLIAPHSSDEFMLDLAAHYQARHPHHLVRPGS